nr:HDOD domain-containing protein [Pseudomonas oleovorans]
MRVLILEDDPWIADLLKQIVLSLCPGAQVDCQSRVGDALAAWKRQAAQLVIADWHLPDGNGTQLLEAVRQRSQDIPLVMVTARADRDSVLAIRPLNISAFISKPFQVPKVIASLQPLLANAQSIAGEVDHAGDFLQQLARLTDDALELPLRESLYQRLRDVPQPFDNLQQLGDLWQNDPAVHARLIAAANSGNYNSAGQPCVTLNEAVQRLGQATAINLVQGLALRPQAVLSDPELQRQGDAHFVHALRLRKRIAELARSSRVDPAPLHSAALLQRMGELALLDQAQRWRSAGRELDEQTLNTALQRHSSQLANRLKAHWRLPIALRELIGACYALPPGNTRRDTVVMRLASAELLGAEAPEIERLRRLAGLARTDAR